MKKVANYLGQLRLYSLADLMLKLVAAGASPASPRFWGAVFLWIGFLAYLESEHHDEGRETVPSLSAWLLILLGLLWWKDSMTGYLFVMCSVCYTQKKQRPWGLISPFMRGAQALVLVGALTGFNQWFPWVAAVATGWRNWKGDQRDVEEDRGDGEENRTEVILTWPVLMGQEKDKPFGHLAAVLTTTWIWWWFSTVPWLVPLGINAVQIAAYWRTPRKSNRNANLTVCGKTLLYHGRWGGR